MAYPGKYFDGKTTKAVSVSVSLGAEGVILAPVDGGAVIHWAYGDIDSGDLVRPGQPVRLSPKLEHDARLLIDDPNFAAALLAQAGHLRRRFGRRGLRKSEIWFIALACFTSLFLLAAFIPTTNKYLVRFFPDSLERRLGNQTRALLLGGKRTCRDEAAQAIMDNLAARLTQRHPVANLRVHLVDWALPNAFALAGGEVIFTQGIMSKLANGNQFAGVLAHEIAHQREKHPLQAVLRIYGLEFIVRVLFGDDSMVTGLGGTVLLLAFSREMEAEADRIAVELLRDGKIDASGLAGFFNVMNKARSKKQGRTIFSYLSTHPGTSQRIEDLMKIDNRVGFPAMSEADWQILRRNCDAEFGHNSKSGVKNKKSGKATTDD